MLALAPAIAARAEEAAAPASAGSPSYSAGVVVGESLHRGGVTNEIDPDTFIRGFRDALAGKASTPDDREQLSKLMEGIHAKIGERNKAAAVAFLAKNGKEKGVVTTASGLQYKVVTPGDAKAAAPTSTSEVTVHYRGKLLDGTEFDSSYGRGTPASFPVNGVIKGWQEALVLMKPGAKWQLWVPPELAYDMNSRPPIPPGSLLSFEVELQSIKAPPQQ
jgi:FKBP-type peptidyl-prolyl cis-trans isomerase FklB